MPPIKIFHKRKLRLPRLDRHPYAMATEARPASWKILLAFGIIYCVWGSTFLAIRVGVREISPFLMAGMRFLAAGLLLYGWMRVKGVANPAAREWRGICIQGTLIFLVDYGCVFWAEQRVPSGITAVVLGTIAIFIPLLEISILRTQQLTLRLSLALAGGICGVAVLMNRTFSLGEAPIDRMGALALLIAAFTWSVATILTRKLTLPASKPMSAAAQMTVGGIQLLALAAATGEFAGFDPGAVSLKTWLALVYLIFAGSIAGFTAYIWLLHYESPTKVGTYAYVNPVVAVLVGHFAGGESIGLRTIVGSALVLVSVVVISTMPAKSRARTPATAKLAPAGSSTE